MLLRLKEDYDGAEPSASSMSVLNLLTLTHLVPRGRAPAKAERTLSRLGPRTGAAARAVPMMLCALSTWHAVFSQIVIVGDRGADADMALQRELASHYLPFGFSSRSRPAPRSRPSHRTSTSSGDDGGRGAAAYVCRDFACQQPVSDPAALAALLDGLSRMRGESLRPGFTEGFNMESSDDALGAAAVRTRCACALTQSNITTMTFDVEIVLRDRDYAVTQQLAIPGAGRRTPADWNDEDVEQLLKAILLAIDRAKHPDSAQRYVALRGFSWIVEPTSAAAWSSPSRFRWGPRSRDRSPVEQAALDRMIRRVIAAAAPNKPVVH